MAEAQKPQPTEVVKNCPACKKVLKKAKKYYKNGKYFCTKNCYKKFTADAQAAQAEAAAKTEAKAA